MNRLTLPIGYQTFQDLRKDGCYYVDKTVHIHRLVRIGRYYFLSRPRRFGKSLLLDTLKELFEGNEPLFRGLHIHDRWDWTDTYPVVRLSFGAKFQETGDLETDIIGQLHLLERDFEIAPSDVATTGPTRFRNLLHELHRKIGRQVVVLVDEYDKPILDVLQEPDLARANREYLRGFYGVIKDCSRLVRFTFVTGITMFSKGSLFSGLNNLEDISLDPEYATICGYTEQDLDTVFAPELPGLDREEIRHWYNGYHWLGEEKVYNPYDILWLFRRRIFKNYWTRTGTPSYLFDLIRKEDFNPLVLEKRSVPESLLAEFDVNRFHWEALLFQSGYLTIDGDGEGEGDVIYTLDYPNREVRESLNSELFRQMFGTSRTVSEVGGDLSGLLASNDFEGFKACIRSHFAGLSYQTHSGRDDRFPEYWFGGMVYMSLRSVEVDIRMEESSSRGRSDMVVMHADQVFVFEFKVINGEEGSDPVAEGRKALVQIREKGYAEKYRGPGRKIHLIGMVFGRKERNLLELSVEEDEH